MSGFKLLIEDHKDDKIKIEVGISEGLGTEHLCEILFTAGNTLKQNHLPVLRTLFFCCLQVLKEDAHTMDQVRKILRNGEH